MMFILILTWPSTGRDDHSAAELVAQKQEQNRWLGAGGLAGVKIKTVPARERFLMTRLGIQLDKQGLSPG